MEFELSLISILLLVAAGFFAGFINTIAGGGSMLTLPALMILGLPEDTANGTNRVAVLMQSLAGMKGFHKKGKLEPSTIMPNMVPAVLGSVLGAILAAYMPITMLKEALLGTMLAMATVILLKPGVVAPPEGTPVYSIREKPLVWFGLFLTGIYGGFVQAGIGFLLILAMAGGLRYDLARANALKVVLTAGLTAVALVIFIYEGQVMWIPGLVMAVGSMVGASASVNFAISVPQVVLKWIMFAMTVAVCIGAYFS